MTKEEFANNKPKGKLGVLIIGIGGAVATTFVAGTLAVRKGKSQPIGSLTQMGRIRLGNRSENNMPLIKDVVPLADLDDIVFGGWDVRKANCYEAALDAEVLTEKDLRKVEDEMKAIEVLPGVFEQRYVKKLHADFYKSGSSKYDWYMALREDIRNFKAKNNCDRVVMIWCASTETYIAMDGVHDTAEHFEKAVREDHADISPSMLYCYAALSENVSFINGSPSLSCDIPFLVQFAKERGIPIAGKDFKTGQTLMKTVLAPMLRAKALGLSGWFSSNILGNRDGEVLDDPGSFKTKEVSKLSVLDGILQPDLYPELYGNIFHKVRIHYYPPRGDNKEGWDNIDIFGWMGYPMQLKIDFLCRDSILAAPLALDLVLFMDYAHRLGFRGIQEWLSFYFKSPIHEPHRVAEHDLFIQSMKMKNMLRKTIGEAPINHIEEEVEDMMKLMKEESTVA